MKVYTINYDKSLKIYNQNKELFNIKECYKNIFNLVSAHPSFFKEMKVCYGYLYIDKSLWCRHCFALYKDSIVDPTCVLLSKNNKNNKYTIFKIFNNLDDYLDAIKENDLYVDLDFLLREEDNKLKKDMLENNQFCI